MNRRTLLRTATMIPIGLALADCAAISSIPQVTAKVVSDINLIADGVGAVLPVISAIGGAGSGIASAVGALVSDAKMAAGAVSTAITTVAAQPFVSTVASDIKAAATALSGISLPNSVASVLSAAQALLPVVQAAVGIVASIPLAGGMAPEAARLILAQAARR